MKGAGLDASGLGFSMYVAGVECVELRRCQSALVGERGRCGCDAPCH